MATHSVSVSSPTLDKLQTYASASGDSVEQIVEEAINRYIDEQQGGSWPPETARSGSLPAAAGDCLRMQSLVPLYIAEPIISLLDGLLEGDHCVADCLAKGNFGLGTLDFLDGEVMVLDGVAYHQGQAGVKVLKGDERTPFMTVTEFDKARCKQVELEGADSLEALQSQLQSHFRSRNVVYAVLIEGAFSYVRSRTVCKQSGHKRLKEVAEQQVVSECQEDDGVLVGFWCPPFVGPTLNEPGFHFHFLSADKQRGGHVLQLIMPPGATAHIQEIHRAQVDLPFRDDFLDSQLNTQQASADLAAAT